MEISKKEEAYNRLIEMIKSYQPDETCENIRKAYELADEAHKEQKRVNGDPYILHPLAVAEILADMEIDTTTITASLLHDVVEDTEYTLEDIERIFGKEVAFLVDGVTKLNRLDYRTKEDQQVNSMRKMFLAMAKDIRVVVIKLADRLHNMRTLKYMRSEKQKRIAQETLEIYAPLAHRLGIFNIKWELEDLSFRYMEPDKYYDLVDQMKEKRKVREEIVNEAIDVLKKTLTESSISFEINGRPKHFYSIYKKMKKDNRDLSQIYDLYAIRVIVDTVQDCYGVLGIVHSLWKPLPYRFKDYIAMPKPNMYQSLHTTLIASNGQPFEIQIRTYEMHRTAEYGIAAHWKYKEGKSGETGNESEEAKLSWLRQILEWQKEMSDNKEFLSSIKNDLNLFSDSVYCFTPSGDVKNLPAGSCPIDFAYSIHSAVGNKMVGARVNGKLVNIDYQIKSGDRIEIITSQNSKGPSRDWLSIVKSTQARNKINQWFKQELKEDNILKGKEMLSTYCKTKGIVLSELTKPEIIEKALRKYGFKDWESMLASVGHGGLKEGQVINKLSEEYEKRKKAEITDTQVLEEIVQNEAKANKETSKKNKGGIVVKGIHDVAVRFSKCCNPVPGDEIVGFVTRGRGISIHRTDCINILNFPDSERARLIEAEWESTGSKEEKYGAEINIFANNRTGLIIDISRVFTEANIDVMFMNSRVNKKGLATINMGFDIHGKEELNRLVDKLRKIEGVTDIMRATG